MYIYPDSYSGSIENSKEFQSIKTKEKSRVGDTQLKRDNYLKCNLQVVEYIFPNAGRCTNKKMSNCAINVTQKTENQRSRLVIQNRFVRRFLQDLPKSRPRRLCRLP